MNILLFAALATAYAAEPEIPANLLPSVECSDAWLIGNSPQPGTAMALSTVVGFGAGHFYSGNKEEGMAHLAVQGGSLGLYVIGALVAANASTSSGARAGSTMSSIGIVGLSVGRIADVYRAPLSAEAARMRSLSGR